MYERTKQIHAHTVIIQGSLPIIVLSGAQSVGDALDGIQNGAGEVVGGVGLVLGAGAKVRGLIVAVVMVEGVGIAC